MTLEILLVRQTSLKEVVNFIKPLLIWYLSFYIKNFFSGYQYYAVANVIIILLVKLDLFHVYLNT